MLVSSASKETMVDSRKGEAMAETQNDPAGRLEVVERKLDRLSASVDERFEQVDERFEQVDERFHRVDKRFDQIDKRFDGIEAALVGQRQYTEFASGRLEAKFEGLQTGFARLERKMDQIIDLHLPRTPPGSSDAAR
jgi:hypothetical protein